MSTAMASEQMVAAGRMLLGRPESATAGLWPRAAALLARQALEETMAGLWATRAPGVERCSMRAQLVCLPRYVDPDLAGRVAFTWSMLSAACHHHAYELSPTAGELARWLDTCEELAGAIAAERPPAS
jgi:hypothetical protein